MEKKKIEKTIATCNATEFMAQCYKIAGKARALFVKAGVGDIRKRVPEYKEEDTPEERKEKMQKQGKENIWAIFDELFGKYPKETTELFGLMCFIEEKDIEKYNGMELISCCLDMLGDENVASFLVSLSKIFR